MCFIARFSVDLFILFGMMMVREAAGGVSNRAQVELLRRTVVFELLQFVSAAGFEFDTSSPHFLHAVVRVDHPELII